MKLIFKSLFFILFLIGSLSAAELRGKFEQGNLLVGKTTPDSKIFIDKKQIKVSKKGFFVFGLNKDRKNDVTIRIIKNGLSKEIINLKKLIQKYRKEVAVM